jgi:Fe-S cluster biosynthesis and repair protein YggX
MSNVDARIAQFENMIRPEADPDNEMAWFSLAQAYAEAGRHAESAGAFSRCIQLNEMFSKAYQLAGAEYIAAGDHQNAATVLTRGYEVATSRGDRMPQRAIADLLKSIDRPVPEVAAPATAATPAVAGTGFVCIRTGRTGTRMIRPPFKGPVGAWIASNISQETFDEWIRQGTKVINELRLDLSRDEDEAVYDAQMREYLGIDEELYDKLTRGKEGTAGS